ncbi:hypothetical protein [Heyndrickxia sp. FSL W8-0423]|uniref:hypothetical protein n=1 Tax=Heyndrickxia sp. FSL W8-0423 TaxID=2921601 RepID=UPI0030FA6DBD
MPYFDTKDRTVYSPVNPKLEPLYSFLEQYQKTFSGSNFFEELLDTYEYLDQVFKEEKQ